MHASSPAPLALHRSCRHNARTGIDAPDVRAQLGAHPAQHPFEKAKRELVWLRELEQLCIARVLERTEGNKTRAAEILGVDPSTLYRREVRGNRDLTLPGAARDR